MPFTAEQFFDVFARYHAGVWPAPVVLTALAVLALVFVFKPGASNHRWVAAILALLWIWMAVAYHIAYFTRINPVAWAFAALSGLGAILFVWVGVVRGRLRFRSGRGPSRWVGIALVLFALVVYPALGHALGHRYPAVPTFGLPCPTTIFTVGVLLLAGSPVPRVLFVVPVLWAAIGASAAFALGVWQDLGLLVAGAVGLLALLHRSTVPDASLASPS